MRNGGRGGKKEEKESLHCPSSSQYSPVLFLCSHFL